MTRSNQQSSTSTDAARAQPMQRVCTNCSHGLNAADKYCARCGQDTANHPPTLGEFLHEFIDHYIAFEGKLWKSLAFLLVRPGFLTREYLAGRKQRYVLPLRLLLTLGLVFFAIIKFSPEDAPTLVVHKESGAVVFDRNSSSIAAPTPPKPASGSTTQAAPRAPKGIEIKLEDWIDWMPARVAQSAKHAQTRFETNPSAELSRISTRMLAMAPYAVLCSMPFYAAFLALLYWRRQQPFGAHVVFAMHQHAAWYALLLIGQLPGAIFGLIAFVWGNVYPVVALQRVYGGRVWALLARCSVLFALHIALLMCGVMLLALAGLLG